jgi:hypothetical protein
MLALVDFNFDCSAAFSGLLIHPKMTSWVCLQSILPHIAIGSRQGDSEDKWHPREVKEDWLASLRTMSAMSTMTMEATSLKVDGNGNNRYV